MASKVISFRLSDAEIQALRILQTSSDKSLNQTAVRLLRSILGTSTDLSTPTSTSKLDIREIVRQEVEAVAMSTSVDSVDMREIVRLEVEAAISHFKREVDERLGEFAA